MTLIKRLVHPAAPRPLTPRNLATDHCRPEKDGRGWAWIRKPCAIAPPAARPAPGKHAHVPRRVARGSVDASGILASAHAFANATVLEVFVRDGCPHCSAAKAHLAKLSTQHPELEIRLREVDRDPAARADLLRLSRDAGVWPPAVPTFVIADQMYYLFRRARAEQPQAHKTTWRHAEANQRCGDAPAGRRHAATAAIAAVADCQG